MNNRFPFITYTLAAFSGICFIGGLVILSSEGSITYVPARGAYIHD